MFELSVAVDPAALETNNFIYWLLASHTHTLAADLYINITFFLGISTYTFDHSYYIYVIHNSPNGKIILIQ